MGKDLNNYQVQMTGENYIAQKLVEKGYIATIVRGNAPETDILARVPNGRSFSVEVKSFRKANFWLCRYPACNTDYWFFVITDIEPKIVSIMTGEEVITEWNNYYEGSCERNPENAIKYPKFGNSFWGLPQGIVKQHAERWDKLPKIDES
jgi:hypothetical protein